MDFEVAGPIRTWKLASSLPTRTSSAHPEQRLSDDVVEGATLLISPAPVTVGGEQWQTLTSGDGEGALVFAGDDVTVVVTGTVDEAALVAFAESLRAD